MPISQLRNQKYSVGDRVEADWKAEGEFFPGADAASELQGRVDGVDAMPQCRLDVVDAVA